jgi:hypothetical protein
MHASLESVRFGGISSRPGPFCVGAGSPSAKPAGGEPDGGSKDWQSSAKIEALMELLRGLRDKWVIAPGLGCCPLAGA